VGGEQRASGAAALPSGERRFFFFEKCPKSQLPGHLSDGAPSLSVQQRMMLAIALVSSITLGLPEDNITVPFSAVPGVANLFVPQVIPGYCGSDPPPSGSNDCYLGEGLLKPGTGFAQYSYIGPFCQPQLQSSAHDPKEYSR
jgi:hypothetical protein